MHSKKFLAYYNNQFEVTEKELILEFFLSFSRFEYALKACNFINGNSRIAVNWDKYIATISSAFDQTLNKELDETLNKELDEAINFIMTKPPKIQRSIKNKLIWELRIFPKNTSSIKKLRLHITDIRNNLFHGSKLDENLNPATSRNYNLLNSAIIVLNNWLELSPDVKKYFSAPII